MSKNTKLNSKGFTLIELLIVIIIIGILAAIAFVAYGSATSKAHKADANSTLAQVKEKMASYDADNNSYPAAGASGATTTNIDNWLNSSAGGNNASLAGQGSDTTQGFTDAHGYTYAVTPAGCGDTVASDGTITTGSTACTGFTLTANGSTLGFSGTITTSN